METLLHAYYDGLRLFALDCFLLWITVIMASLFPWRIKLLDVLPLCHLGWSTLLPMTQQMTQNSVSLIFSQTTFFPTSPRLSIIYNGYI